MPFVIRPRRNPTQITSHQVFVLYHFLKKHFDETLPENQARRDVAGFEWYLTYNFYTFDAIKEIIMDIKVLIKKLMLDYNNPNLDIIMSPEWLRRLAENIKNSQKKQIYLFNKNYENTLPNLNIHYKSFWHLYKYAQFLFHYALLNSE